MRDLVSLDPCRTLCSQVWNLERLRATLGPAAFAKMWAELQRSIALTFVSALPRSQEVSEEACDRPALNAIALCVKAPSPLLPSAPRPLRATTAGPGRDGPAAALLLPILRPGFYPGLPPQTLASRGKRDPFDEGGALSFRIHTSLFSSLLPLLAHLGRLQRWSTPSLHSPLLSEHMEPLRSSSPLLFISCWGNCCRWSTQTRLWSE